MTPRIRVNHSRAALARARRAHDPYCEVRGSKSQSRAIWKQRSRTDGRAGPAGDRRPRQQRVSQCRLTIAAFFELQDRIAKTLTFGVRSIGSHIGAHSRRKGRLNRRPPSDQDRLAVCPGRRTSGPCLIIGCRAVARRATTGARGGWTSNLNSGDAGHPDKHAGSGPRIGSRGGRRTGGVLSDCGS
jgi:hypothetical protein